MRKRILILLAVLFFLLWVFPDNGYAGKESTVTIAMCRPSTGQIKNIVILRNSGILDIKDLKLLCVYHEDELTDYKESFSYVKENGINWVEFVKIVGRVGIGDIFKKNIWTSQFRSVFQNSDGIIFTGGMDIPPSVYGEENSLLTEATTPVRTFYETSFLFHLIGGSRNSSFVPLLEERKGFPVLGICLGAQTMNVAAGGTLIQDIPSEIYGLRSIEQVLRLNRDNIHSSIYMKLMYPGKRDLIAPAFHRIKYTKNSILLRLFFQKNRRPPMVLSSHHQSVKKIGQNLFVAARSVDGKIIEAIEHKKYKNVLGVQFHPEVGLLYDGVRLFTVDPNKGDYFTLKDFLKNDIPSFQFHMGLWKWFTKTVKEGKHYHDR